MSIISTLEDWVNSAIKKLFPVWYISQVVRGQELPAIGALNPPSFLSHRWLSLQSVVKNTQEALVKQEGDWQEFLRLIGQLVKEADYSRFVSLLEIKGVQHSQVSNDYISLVGYAQENSGGVEINNAEDFEEVFAQAFPSENKPFPMAYREWDGRYYYLNQDEPTLLAALQKYAYENKRDMTLQCKLKVESLAPKVLDKLQHDWWMIVLENSTAENLAKLMQDSGLAVALSDFSWHRDDISLLIASKKDKSINRIFLNLIDQRSVNVVSEFGSFLGRHHYPLVTDENRG